MAIACGYEDANDAARLASDPMHKLLVGRDPVQGEDLASQPTLSRFENRVSCKELFRMAKALADTVIERHRERLHGRARLITIDLDFHRRSHAWQPAANLFQLALRHVLLPAGGGVSDLRRGGRAVSRHSRVASRERTGLAGAVWHPAPSHRAAEECFSGRENSGCAWMAVLQRRKFWIF